MLRTGRRGLDFLQPRGCRYLGLDFNGHFVMGIRKRGARALTNPGVGTHGTRFDLESLRGLAARHGAAELS